MPSIIDPVQSTKRGGPAPIQRRAACELLLAALAGGPMTVKTIERLAREAGISRMTLHRARWRLGLERCVIGLNFAWRLPSARERVPEHEED